MIHTIGELKKLIANMDDDFTLEIDYMIEIPNEELVKTRYPYPWRRKECKLEYHDTGYSDKVVCFGVYDK